jgi:hypothetical protein
MLRKMACLVAALCVAGVVSAQTKDKKPVAKPKTTPAKLVSVDAKKMMLMVEMDGKKKEIMVGKDVKFYGPRGGKANIKDKRLTPGAMLGLVMDGSTLKEVWLPMKGASSAPAKDKVVKDKK